MKNAREIEDISCQICGAHRKHEKGAGCKFMSCPDTMRVSSYLKSITGVDNSVKEGDLICSACYKFFIRLLKSGTCVLSSEDIISELRTKCVVLNEAIENFICTTPNSHVVLALYKTALHVCKGLILDQAFLFPCVYRHFLECLSGCDMVDLK